MIPVFQTRTSVESFGNCFEACLASILEVPLTAIPDRGSYIDLQEWGLSLAAQRQAGKDPLDLEQPGDMEAWAKDLTRWLEERGIDLFRIGVRGRDYVEEQADVIGTVEEVFRIVNRYGYWIGEWTTQTAGHAVVMKGGDVAHNPMRGVLGREGLDELALAWIPLLSDVRLFDRLRAEMLPDVAGELGKIRIETRPVVTAPILSEDPIRHPSATAGPRLDESGLATG